jgi:multidrug efflux pump subunit AcrA (membrane-fusion protein)
MERVMSAEQFLDLAECTEFRQAIQARPPRLAHASVLLLVVLLGSGLGWAALTRADLVVRAGGRVRPVSTPIKVVNPVRGETFSASVGARVVEVRFRPGDTVRKGDVLLRLDTERLDSEIARRRRTIEAGTEELAKNGLLEKLLDRQAEADRAKIEAELAQALEEIRQARERQTSDLRVAQRDLTDARNEAVQVDNLIHNRALAPIEAVKARARLREAQEKVAKLQLPVDEGKAEVLRKALAVTEKDHALKRTELETRQEVKRGEVEAARIELASLEQERKQAVLVAPLDGVVTAGEVQVGDILEGGKPVAEIAEQSGFRFEALVPSDEVGHLRPGMPARIKLDAYDYQRYGTLEGTVSFVAPDSTVAEGSKTAVYLVKVAVAGDAVGRGDLRGAVKLGMAGQVEIVTGQEGLLLLLVKRVRQTISLG